MTLLMNQYFPQKIDFQLSVGSEINREKKKKNLKDQGHKKCSVQQAQ